MGYWLKLYTDILDDSKYFKLSKNARLGMYELLLVAKKLEDIGEKTGDLPDIEEIAFQTRSSVEEWKEIIIELSDIGFLESNGDGFTIKNYEKRQSAIADKVRAKQSRKKINDNTMNTSASRVCNDDVTNASRDFLFRDGEKRREEKETEKELINQNFYSKFQEILQIPITNSREMDYLNDLKSDYGEEKLMEIAEWYSGLENRNYSTWSALRAIDTAGKKWNKQRPKTAIEALEEMNKKLEQEQKEVLNGEQE